MDGFTVTDADLLRAIMDHLRSKNMFDALVTLQLESGVSERRRLEPNLRFLHRLCLQGEWDRISLFLAPLERASTDAYEKAIFFVKRQKYLEALSWLGSGGRPQGNIAWKPVKGAAGGGDSRASSIASGDMELDMEAAVAVLKSMEKYCTPLEYSAFCYCLTLERLTDNPAFADWTVSRGRLECFDAIAALIDGREISSEPLRPPRPTNASSLLNIVGSGLQHLHDHAVKTAGHPSRVAHWTLEEGLVLYHMPRNTESTGVPVMHIVSNDEELSPDLRPPSIAPGAERPSSRNSGRNKRNTEESVQLLDSFGLGAENKTIEKTIDDRFKEAKSSIEANKNEKFRDLSGRIAGVPAPNPTPKAVPDAAAIPPAAPVPRQPPVAWVVGADPVPTPPAQQEHKNNAGAAERNVAVPVAPAAPVQLTVETKFRDQDPSMNDEATIGSAVSNRSGVTTVDRRSHIPAPQRQQVQANTPSSKIVSKQPVIIFETPNCPLRSISIVSSELDILANKRGGQKDRVIFGIGSNAKKIHLLQYELPSDSSGLGAVTPINEFLDVHKGSVYATDWYCHQNDMLGGGILASGSNDKLIRVLRPFSKNPSLASTLAGHNGTIRTIKFRDPFAEPQSQLAPLLASGGSGDCCVRVWDINAEICTSSFAAHEAAVHALQWVDENNVISGCEQGWLVCHDMRSPQYSWKIQVASEVHQGIFSIAKVQNAYNPVDLYMGLANGGFCSYNIQARRFSIAPTKVHEEDVRCVVAWQDAEKSTEGRRSISVLTTSYDGSASMWSSSPSAESSPRGGASSASLIKKASLLNGHTDKVLSAARCQHTGTVVTTGADGRAVLWK